ncbi:MAG: hypothetical protein M3487_01895 [Actinomycetota bacterium]|nr:hypothetical protein [Acidimicrobiia bacterium]MDQ3468519.1 hypothetical protein [Actinomycetota bacterium]
MAKKHKTTIVAPKVSRDDLERSFRSLQDGMKGKVDDKRSTVVTAATVAGVVVVLLVFLLGRRSGKRKTTLVEIRRV